MYILSIPVFCVIRLYFISYFSLLVISFDISYSYNGNKLVSILTILSIILLLLGYFAISSLYLNILLEYSPLKYFNDVLLFNKFLIILLLYDSFNLCIIMSYYFIYSFIITFNIIKNIIYSILLFNS
nr:MAG TPA: hypothetical protein [Bacteriophage sp.]